MKTISIKKWALILFYAWVTMTNPEQVYTGFYPTGVPAINLNFSFDSRAQQKDEAGWLLHQAIKLLDLMRALYKLWKYNRIRLRKWMGIVKLHAAKIARYAPRRFARSKKSGSLKN